MLIHLDGAAVSLATFFKDAHNATDVRVGDCPGLTSLPALPAATGVRVDNCPGLTSLPALPAATDVRVDNCPGVRPGVRL